MMVTRSCIGPEIADEMPNARWPRTDMMDDLQEVAGLSPFPEKDEANEKKNTKVRIPWLQNAAAAEIHSAARFSDQKNWPKAPYYMLFSALNALTHIGTIVSLK